MCRIIVSLSCIKVSICSHYATKRYRELKLSIFHRISASLDTGNGFDLYDTDLVQKLFNTRDFGANFEFEKYSHVLNLLQILFLHMHIE